MNKIFQRYLAAGFVAPFLISCIFFVSFLLSFKLFSLTNLVVNKGLSLSLTFVLLGHIAITFLPMAFPISALFASLYSMGKLSRDSEYIALKSFGISKLKIVRPYIIVSLFIGLMIFLLNNELIPRSQVQFRDSVRALESSQFLADIKEGRFFTSIPNVTIFSEKVTEKGTNLENIFIHIDSPKSNVEKTIFSKKGQMIKKRNFESSSESLRLVLSGGNIADIDSKNEKLEKIIFQEYDFPISEGSFKPNYRTKPSMMSSSTLIKIMKMDEQKAKEKGIDDKYANRIRFEFWNRINTPFLCIIFSFLGVCLGVQDNRGKKKNVGAISLLLLVTYYSVFFLLVTLSRKGAIPTPIAVFLPTAGTLYYAIKHYKKMDWFA